MSRTGPATCVALLCALTLWPAVAAPVASVPEAYVLRGEGRPVVLVSGLLGSVHRLLPLADAIAAQGHRVLVVDPYRLSAAEADLSFRALAGRVAALMATQGLDDALIVAHAHGAGVAVRLAANHASAVRGLLLLDAGAVPETASPGVRRGLRIASLLARVPGGGHILRSALASGLRANSGNAEWVTAGAVRAYGDSLLRHLPTASRVVTRLGEAREPEDVVETAARLRVPVVVLLGAAPHEFSPEDAELEPLRALPQLTERRLEGVGHFLHEEAPGVVLQWLLRLCEATS